MEQRLVLNRHKSKTGQIYKMYFGRHYDGLRQAERGHIPFSFFSPHDSSKFDLKLENDLWLFCLNSVESAPPF